MNDWVSTLELSNLIGISDRSVRNAIADGKIPSECVRKQGKGYVVHAAIAAPAWAAALPTSSHTAQQTRLKIEAFIATLSASDGMMVYSIKKDKKTQHDANIGAQAACNVGGINAMGSSSAAMKDALCRKEMAIAAIKEYEMQERAGMLVSKTEADRQLFQMGRMLRDNLCFVPNAIVDEVISKHNDRHAAANIIHAAIEKVLVEFCDNMSLQSKAGMASHTEAMANAV